MDDMLRMGKITSTAGLKGEVKVYPYTDYKEKFEEVDYVLLGGKELPIQKVRYQKNMAVLKLAGIESVEEAERVRDEILYIRRADAPPLPEDTYYVKDLLGLAVKDESGERIGTLKDVIQNSAQDLYEIEKKEGGAFLLPAVEEFVLVIDMEKKVMTVRLLEGIADL